MKSEKKKRSDNQTLSFGGDLSLRNAVSLKTKLDAVSFSCNTVGIHLKEVEILDITIIQILYSLIHELQSQGKEISLSIELSEDLQKVLSNAGFKTLINQSSR